MVSSSSASFSGSLQSKKKAELQEIANALKLNDAGTGEELQQRTKQHLDENTDELEDDPAFSGLYSSRKRQRSLQAQDVSSAPRAAVRGRLAGVKEQRDESPADELNDVSVLLPKAPPSPPKSARNIPIPETPSSLPPLPPSVAPSPTKSIIADAMSQPEVQAVVEMERSLAKSSQQFLLQTRSVLSNGTNIFTGMAILDLLGILFMVNYEKPVYPYTAEAVPILYAMGQSALQWALPTVVLPTLFGFLISFASAQPRSSLSFDPLSAAILRVAFNIAYEYPGLNLAPTPTGSRLVSTDVLGFKWRMLSSGVTFAFALAEAIGRQSYPVATQEVTTEITTLTEEL